MRRPIIYPMKTHKVKIIGDEDNLFSAFETLEKSANKFLKSILEDNVISVKLIYINGNSKIFIHYLE